VSYAVLYVFDFSIQAIVRTRADLGGKPVALLDDRVKPAVVGQADARARAAGVTPGLTTPQAMARCADIVLLPRSAAAEQDATAALLTVAWSLSPRVESTAAGLCTIDLAGKAAAAHLPHSRAAVERLQSLGLEAAAGVARTPFLALIAARLVATLQSGWSGLSPSRSGRVGDNALHLLAGDNAEAPDIGSPAQRCRAGSPHPAAFGKMAGYGDPVRHPAESLPRERYVLEVRDERGFLWPLPLSLADPPPDLAAILAGWGIRTLGALTALPKPEVGRRLGQAGIELWERAAGETDRPIKPCAPDATFAAAMELEHEVETLEPLLFVLRRLVDRLALQLVNAGVVAAEFALALLLVDETAYQRGFRLPEPTASPDILFRALQTHLETLRTESAIKGVRLAITPTRPLVRQHGLFDTGLRDPHGFAETLARVAAVVGRDRVGTPGLEPTDRPDAFFLEKPVDLVGPLPPPPILPPLGLPLRRFRPPVEAEVTTGPQGPAVVRCRIVQDEVTRRRGPWRRSGEWWKPERWTSEEWDVELARGGLFRLSLRAGQWWVEGMYD
jgi:protein ImuB